LSAKHGGNKQLQKWQEGFVLEAESCAKTYDHFPSHAEMLEEIQRLQMHDKNDPASLSYERVYVRPRVSVANILLHGALPVALCALLTAILLLQHRTIAWLPPITLIAYVCVRLKVLLLFFIKVYQRFAPVWLRSRCRFEPSCSEYMRIAIEKYGCTKGMRKGLNRIKRCKNLDGGFDDP
jgi:putative membrane protein insertion efficiency factor